MSQMISIIIKKILTANRQNIQKIIMNKEAEVIIFIIILSFYMIKFKKTKLS